MVWKVVFWLFMEKNCVLRLGGRPWCKSNTQRTWYLLHVGGVEMTWQHVVGRTKNHAGGVMTSARRGRDDVAKDDWLPRAVRGGRVDVAHRDWLARYYVGGVISQHAEGVLTRGKLVMEGTANLVVYRDGEIIRNTHESEVCVPESVFICGSMHHDVNGASEWSLSKHGDKYVNESEQNSFDTMPITDEVSMQNMFQIHRQTQMRQPQIELYVEFETVEVERTQNDLEVVDDRAALYEEINSDSEEDFEATYEAGDEDEDGDVGVETAAENVVVHPSISQPMNV
ncbi:hypothetical protein Ahy_A01g004039 isoform B [Arachis hypogaea]|uniref:Uncharacterized protein n=1 Tax=Arachis hypogaea TaxID=3818 RepID=A0A445EV36_ARAHY|nr:hypothetical protein Ahy_A01g004039 isoform B [Arachis hypogaea]